jgi:hypothetical protein
MARHVSSDADAPPPPKRRTPAPAATEQGASARRVSRRAANATEETAAATTRGTATQVRTDPFAPAPRAGRPPAAPPRPAPAPPAPQPSTRPVARDVPRRAAPWWARVVCWVVAIPVGMLLVAWPAWHYEIIDRQKLIDVIAAGGLSRFLPLLAVAAVWALVTALIVHGMLTLIERRRRTPGSPASPVGPVASHPAAPPPPPRAAKAKSAQRRGRNGARTGS